MNIDNMSTEELKEFADNWNPEEKIKEGENVRKISSRLNWVAGVLIFFVGLYSLATGKYMLGVWQLLVVMYIALLESSEDISNKWRKLSYETGAFLQQTHQIHEKIIQKLAQKEKSATPEEKV